MNRSDNQFEPSVIELHDIDSVTAFRRLSHLPYCLFLDSSLADERLGRYSFITCDPFDLLSLPVGDTRRHDKLRQWLHKFEQPTIRGLPPFQGGAAGLISYDFGRSLEHLPAAKFDNFELSVMMLGAYDLVVAFDHHLNQAWIVSQGFPETSHGKRQDRAERRLDWLRSQLANSNAKRDDVFPLAAGEWNRDTDGNGLQHRIELDGPNHPLEGHANLLSNFSPGDYLSVVQKAIDYIHAGDVFQVNLAQRLMHPARSSSLELYLRLREKNAATFSGYFDLGQQQILSTSPERFLQVRNRRVEARPIKGTRQRTSQPEADLFAGSELKQSDKDLAENVMIVDLMRNDLSRVCEPDSICVQQLCEVETFAFVQHLVSAVTGQLSADHSVVDLLEASFPGGSITGAPKIRAMEIIAELEPHARGAYCGSLGYFGFDGSMDLSILIRTITASHGWWQIPVGGGIVADSIPQLEYEETWHKALGMLRAINA